MKLSIITATLNSSKYLAECSASILTQKACDYEHIVVDGGSADQTVSVARRYPNVTVIERAGCSIYEAWNIGLAAATGELIGFCNSDDYYAPNTFMRVLQELTIHPEAWIISGKAIQFRNEGSAKKYLKEHSNKTPDHFSFECLELFGPAINARFFRKELFSKYGNFDTRFRLGADCSFLVGVALNRLPAVSVDEVFYYYRSHLNSSTLGGNIKNLFISLEEKLTIGDEFIKSGRLQPQEVRHLRQAMGMQFAATIAECVVQRSWSNAVKSLNSFRSLGFWESAILWRNVCGIAWSYVMRGFSGRVSKCLRYCLELRHP